MTEDSEGFQTIFEPGGKVSRWRDLVFISSVHLDGGEPRWNRSRGGEGQRCSGADFVRRRYECLVRWRGPVGRIRGVEHLVCVLEGGSLRLGYLRRTRRGAIPYVRFRFVNVCESCEEICGLLSHPFKHSISESCRRCSCDVGSWDHGPSFIEFDFVWWRQPITRLYDHTSKSHGNAAP